MSTELIVFAYQGREVAFDSAVKMWNLNAMHQAAGGEPSKAPVYWARGVQAKELIAALEVRETMRNSHSLAALAERETTFQDGSLIEAREGRNGGTWAHWQIAAAYAHYLNPDFYIQWNEWAMERIEQLRAGQVGIDAAELATLRTAAEQLARLQRGRLTEQQRMDHDVVQFVSQCCERRPIEDQSAAIPVAAFYDAYVTWAAQQGYRRMSRYQLNRRMPYYRLVRDRRNVWWGIVWKPAACNCLQLQTIHDAC